MRPLWGRQPRCWRARGKAPHEIITPPAARQNPPRRDAMNRVSPARSAAPHRHPSPRCVGRGEFPRRRPPQSQEGCEALCAIWQTVKADSDRRPPSSEFSTPQCGRATDPSHGSPSPSHRSADPRDGNTHPRPHSNGKTPPQMRHIASKFVFLGTSEAPHHSKAPEKPRRSDFRIFASDGACARK